MSSRLYSARPPAVDIQKRLHGFAAAFLFAYSLALTLSPAVRLHSWKVAYPWVHWVGFLVWAVGFSLLNCYLQKRNPDADPILLPIISLLVGWGLLTIYRIDSYYGLRQTAWLAICLVLLWQILRSPNFLENLRKYKYLWLVLGILLVALTLIIGVYPGGFGPELWLGFAGFFFQPSELLKLLLVVFLSAYMADRLRVTFSYSQLITPVLILFSIAVSILLVQRDMGTSALLIILFSVTLFLAAGKYQQLALSFLVILIAGAVGYYLFDVIRLRVDAWVNPWLDPSGRSYQIVQSIMAVAAGGIFGRGPGMGSPRVVPVAQSDFIFSAIAEEAGFVGTAGLIILLILLLYRGFRIAFRAKSRYYRILAAGITSFLVFQSILIIGGNLRVLPLTGVTLPFISYGGSSLLVSIICGGILIKTSDTGGEDPAMLEKPTPYFIIIGLAMAGLAATLLANGWWSIIRSNDLLARTDNPRLGINEKYSPRGNILDSQGQAVNATQGVEGSYTRKYLYPPLSPVFGFDTSSYGQTGLESSLDGYLRGERGVPSSTIWWRHLLYGQPPAGLNIRTSIDLNLQQQADQLLEGKKGALVLLNAQTGEVLAMASHPNVDPNQADTMWTGWMQDPQSPLINRATQSAYPVGTILSTFLLPLHAGGISTIDPPGSENVDYNGVDYSCSFTPEGDDNWKSVIAAGCPEAYSTLARISAKDSLLEILKAFGFSNLPEFILPQAPNIFLPAFTDPQSLAFGDSQLRATPLQVALAASAITNGGTLPSPKLAVAYQNASGWVYFPNGETSPIDSMGTSQVSTILASGKFPGWEATGKSKSSQGNFAWYIGGTAASWDGAPLAIALVLEEDSPLDARAIGREVLQAGTNLK